LNQWEIWTWEFPGGSHPAVLISSPARLAAKAEVNLLMCSSHRAARRARAHEVLLDAADGLDWETLCRCDIIFLAEKSQLRQLRGSVTLERRRQLVRRMIESMAWVGL